MAVGSSCCEMFGSVQKRTKLFFCVGTLFFRNFHIYSGWIKYCFEKITSHRILHFKKVRKERIKTSLYGLYDLGYFIM